MSGFVGWIDFERDLSSQEDIVRRMTQTMRRRGPDGEGMWMSRHAALGHRSRLAAAGEGGRQPALAHRRGDALVLAYDGKIYNCPALRRGLEELGHRFETNSEAEVLLQAYLTWGNGFVDRLEGMFAFAIWDAGERRLLLGRDRWGAKPLYYFEYPRGLLFASEPKGIMANPLFEARLDFSRISILLQPRFALPGETPLLGLREVPRAHVVAYSPAGISLHGYWQLASAPHRDTPGQTARHVRELLEDIVSRQLDTGGSGEAVGAMLSGGLDSTTVSALAMLALRKEKAGRTLDTFCIRFEGDSEKFAPSELRPDIDAPYAASAAEFIGSRHRTVTARTEEVLAAIPETRRARDLPGWGQFDGSTYLLFERMRRHCTVAVTGEAADELFGGYPYFFNPGLIRRDHFPWLEDGPKLSDYLSTDLLALVDPRADEYARYRQWISDVPRLPGEAPEDARMREVFYLTTSGRLSVLLDRMDRMSMSVGLEMRLPFCDHRLAEYLWNVPWSIKSAGGMKGLLKAAMRDVLPASTVDRKKSAYPHIQSEDYDRALLREAVAILEDGRSPVASMFDTARLRGLVGEIEAGEAGLNAAHVFIHLIEIGRWIDDYRISLR